ncbi:MAG: hypothetical protein C4524_06980 [Candidatus Zixiibacteriota bacterium]|nr:MAG: hypothetical protein C4524_06980 [candidate division Zixibacteria bacterium]
MKTTRYTLTALTLAGLLWGASPAPADTGGYIYGKITTRGNQAYTGILRWGTQECFWDDLFNAVKEDNPWGRYARDDEGGKTRTERKITLFGTNIVTVTDGGGFTQHQFMTRFGDLKHLDVNGDDRIIAVMKSGAEYEISGYGDVGETIQVLDQSLGQLKIKWEEIDRIEFLETPRNAKVPGYRLKGKVATASGEYRGWVMWDAEECLSTDVLDGEGEAGDMAVEFGNIRSLKRRSSRSCDVLLKDGRTLELRGTNDVNESNRGIFVEDERYGKLEIPWDELREVTYEDDDGSSGRPYDAYKPAAKLSGTVTAVGGKQYKGRLVFDFDEEEGSEMLEGNRDEIQFHIPFSRLASITPRSRHRSEVELRGGEKLLLEDAQDVTEANDGLLIFTRDDSRPEHVPWAEVEKIEFKK